MSCVSENSEGNFTNSQTLKCLAQSQVDIVTPAQMMNGSKWKRPTFSFSHLYSGPYHDNTCLQQKK